MLTRHVYGLPVVSDSLESPRCRLEEDDLFNEFKSMDGFNWMSDPHETDELFDRKVIGCLICFRFAFSTFLSFIAR